MGRISAFYIFGPNLEVLCRTSISKGLHAGVIRILSDYPSGNPSCGGTSAPPYAPFVGSGKISKIQKGGASHLCAATTPSVTSVTLATLQPQADALDLDVDLNLGSLPLWAH
ncbi:MAG: hypothetical protein ACFWUL_05465 [Dialister sp.]